MTEYNPSKIAIIKHNVERGSIYRDAFTSSPFLSRVQAGYERARDLGAESGLSILTNNLMIIYPPLNLGGKSAETLGDIGMGLKATVSVMPEISYKWFEDNKLRPEDLTYIAYFHFHPYSMEFSDTDMSAYDNAPLELSWNGYKADPRLFAGIFTPPREGEWGDTVRILMFQGPAETNYYQIVDFDKLGYGSQIDALKKSGMNVIHLELPVNNGRVSLRRLASALK